MATLNIGGRRVQVDDSFLSLPPDQQNAAVEEIAKSLLTNAKVNPETNQPPGVPAFQPPGVEGYNQQTGEVKPQPYSPGGSAAMGAADAATLGWGDELASYLGSAMSGVPRDQVLSQMRGDAQAAQQDNPGSYLAGQIGGGLAQAAATGGGGFGTAAARGGGGLFRVALGGAADGALGGGAYGAGSADGSLKDRIAGMISGGGIGLAAGGALPMAVAGASKAIKTAVTPFSAPSERIAAADFLSKEGVPLTAGQRTGSKALRYAESELGGAKAANIMDQQAEAFTNAAMQRAGGSGRATSENMSAMADRLGQGFNEIASRNSLSADGKLLQDMVGTLQEYNRVLPSEQRQILGNIASDIGDRIKTGNGTMSGADYQTIRSRLTRMAHNYRNSDNEFSTALRGLRNALDGNMERSINPADASAWSELRRQYGNMKTLEKAIGGAGGEDAAMGLISPARLRMAASVGNRGGYARGQGNFADLAKAGQAVMTPLPNSGTAARTAVRNLGSPMLAGGAALAGGVPGLVAGLAAPTLAGKALMSAPVQRYLSNQAASSARNPVRDAIVAALLRGGTLPTIEGR